MFVGQFYLAASGIQKQFSFRITLCENTAVKEEISLPHTHTHTHRPAVTFMVEKGRRARMKPRLCRLMRRTCRFFTILRDALKWMRDIWCREGISFSWIDDFIKKNTGLLGTHQTEPPRLV